MVHRTSDRRWDQLGYKLLFCAFLVTTTVGALTGVGIWLSASLINPYAIRLGYRWAFVPTLLQFLVGPLVMLTLPPDGLTGRVIATILTGAMIALPALILMYGETRSAPATIGRRFWPVVLLISCTVLFMASGRHIYREASLADHREKVKAKTAQYMRAIEQTAKQAAP